jgi:hypothetical protein
MDGDGNKQMRALVILASKGPKKLGRFHSVARSGQESIAQGLPWVIPPNRTSPEGATSCPFEAGHVTGVIHIPARDLALRLLTRRFGTGRLCVFLGQAWIEISLKIEVLLVDSIADVEIVNVLGGSKDGIQIGALLPML